MDPKVSIILPVYNCERYLSNCLDSLLSQTYKNVEIIIVNDGSTDGSEQIINKYKKRYANIIYFYQKNKGPSEARNKAILNAAGDYVVFIDSDDTANKFYIENLLNKMISTGADLVCSGYRDISAYGVNNHTDFNFDIENSLHSFLEMVCKGTGGVLWGKIFKRDIIDQNNLVLDKGIFMSEDLVFVLRYATYCKTFGAIQEYLYNYNRLNETSISSNVSIEYLQNYITVCKCIEDILKSVNIDRTNIKNILTKRIQDTVINLVDQQSTHIKIIGFKNAFRNIKKILSDQYIQKYKSEFISQSFLYMPYVFCIKKNLVKSSFFYGYYINALKSIKRKFTKRRQVIT